MRSLIEQSFKLLPLGSILEMEYTICTCTTNTLCGDQIYQQPIVNQKSNKSVWDGFRHSVGTIGEVALDILRDSNDPELVFSNGETRVLIRPDRIDLI